MTPRLNNCKTIFIQHSTFLGRRGLPWVGSERDTGDVDISCINVALPHNPNCDCGSKRIAHRARLPKEEVWWWARGHLQYDPRSYQMDWKHGRYHIKHVHYCYRLLVVLLIVTISPKCIRQLLLYFITYYLKINFKTESNLLKLSN